MDKSKGSLTFCNAEVQIRLKLYIPPKRCRFSLALSLSLPERYNSFLKNIVGKCCIQVGTVRGRRQTYWQAFFPPALLKETPFYEFVCAKRAINCNKTTKIMSEKRCQCLVQSANVPSDILAQREELSGKM